MSLLQELQQSLQVARKRAEEALEGKAKAEGSLATLQHSHGDMEVPFLHVLVRRLAVTGGTCCFLSEPGQTLCWWLVFLMVFAAHVACMCTLCAGAV